MRIAYLAHINLGLNSGVFQKVLGQIKMWCREGNSAKLFIITRDKDFAGDTATFGVEVETIRYTWGMSSAALHTRIQAFKKAEKLICAWKPNIIYTRQDLFYPSVVRMAKRHPLAIEVNTNDVREMTFGSRITWLYHLLTRGLTIKNAAGCVFVSNELSVVTNYGKYCRPFVVIGNGIDLDSIAPLPQGQSNGVHLVFVGQTGCPWHGIDKIAYMASAYSEWRIDVIGVRREEVRVPFPDNVIFHGVMSLVDYRDIMARADCGIGTLALHRNRMSEASPLKTREYLAYGLPVIIGYDDTDFPQGADFLLQIPNSEDNVERSLGSIGRFVASWKDKRIPRDAILHLASTGKESLRLGFFRTLADNAERTSIVGL